MVTALERSGIGAHKHKDESGAGAAAVVFVVKVASPDAVRALETLRAFGLPRGRRSGFAEVYAQPSLVPTATEERARYLEALAGEIERTLETVDGVVNARVHLVLAETDPLAVEGKPRVPAQAAVLLKARPGLSPIKDSDVQKLVSGSVPGLQPTSVAVVVTAAPENPSTQPVNLAAIGPLRVTPGSRPLLLAGLGVTAGVVVILAALLFYLARRLSSIQRQLTR